MADRYLIGMLRMRSTGDTAIGGIRERQEIDTQTVEIVRGDESRAVALAERRARDGAEPRHEWVVAKIVTSRRARIEVDDPAAPPKTETGRP